jgi:hypothetical protein
VAIGEWPLDMESGLASHLALLDARPIALAIVEVAGAVTGTTRTAELVFEDLSSGPGVIDSNTRVLNAGMSSNDTPPFSADNLAGMENRCDARTTE